MGAPIWLRSRLTKMAVSNVFAPSSACQLCGKNIHGPNFGGKRTGHILRDGKFISVVRHDRALPGHSVACEFLAYPRTLQVDANLQKRWNVTLPIRSLVSEQSEDNMDSHSPEVGTMDDQVASSIGEENDLGDDEVANALAEMTGTISLSKEVPVVSTSLCVGIDPDLSGAIAVLGTRENSTVAEVIDVPCVKVTINKKQRRRHDYQSIATLVRKLRAPEGSIAYVEQAMPFPKDGKQGWYITGYGYGVWLGILAAAGFTVIPVQARVWKTKMGLCGKEFSKDDSRALASSLFPLLSPQLKRKRDHGRAEALLIAAFGKGMTLTSISSLDVPSMPSNISSPDKPHSLPQSMS